MTFYIIPVFFLWYFGQITSFATMRLSRDYEERTQSGFCLAPGSLCSVRLKKGQGRKVGMQIDVQNSRCQHNNQVKLLLTSFAKSSDVSPCTNIPIICPLCPAASDAVWKYNLEAHLKTVHSTANVSEYNSYIALYTKSVSPNGWPSRTHSSLNHDGP